MCQKLGNKVMIVVKMHDGSSTERGPFTKRSNELEREKRKLGRDRSVKSIRVVPAKKGVGSSHNHRGSGTKRNARRPVSVA